MASCFQFHKINYWLFAGVMILFLAMASHSAVAGPIDTGGDWFDGKLLLAQVAPPPGSPYTPVTPPSPPPEPAPPPPGSPYRPADPTECVPNTSTLCLNKSRFKVQVSWRTEDDTTGVGQAVPFSSDDSGMFWFFNEDNWEMLVKVLDGCGFNNNFWVFFAATTDQEFSLTVTDTEAGILKQYYNSLNHPANAVTDTAAFDTCAIENSSSLIDTLPPLNYGNDEQLSSNENETGYRLGQIREDSILSLSESDICTPTETQLCLNGSRFKVQVNWKSQDGRSGQGYAVPYGSEDSGMFWFFNEDNWEMLIKVLDGCNFNNRYWVFFAATTDQEFTVTVTDTRTEEQVQYTNPLGNPANAVTDTDAFASCP